MEVKKLTAIILIITAALTLCSCGEASTRSGGLITTAIINQTESTAPSQFIDSFFDVPEEHIFDDSKLIDRTGDLITRPDEINSIISTSPAISEILSGLGLADRIILADMFSGDITGVDSSVCVIDFMSPDIEAIISLSPDVIFVSEMMTGWVDGIYELLKNAGLNAVYIPTSDTIEGVKLDIYFLSEYTGRKEAGERMLSDINAAVNDIFERTSRVAVKKTVYFELDNSPYLYSFGSNTFLNEILSVCGAVNIFAAQTGWISVSEESIITANPDVIITGVNYDGYDYNEIKYRPGWSELDAVISGRIYQVDANAVSRPSHNIVKGIYMIAESVYPELFY